jgi:glutathione peroxidase-family protein
MIYIHPRIALISRIKEHSHAPLCCLKATWMFHLFIVVHNWQVVDVFQPKTLLSALGR